MTPFLIGKSYPYEDRFLCYAVDDAEDAFQLEGKQAFLIWDELPANMQLSTAAGATW